MMIESEKRLPAAVIMPTGRELLTGRVQDTNSGWLCARLFEIGVRVMRVVAVDDDPNDMAREFERAVGDGAEIVITTGGLGPTPDDMTIRSMAAATGVPMVRFPEAFARIAARYRFLYESGRISSPEMNEYRSKMADLPQGSRILFNDVGSAPGCEFRAGKATVYCLPGPPREMVPMAESQVIPALAAACGTASGRGVLKRLTIESDVCEESMIAVAIRKIQDDWPGVHFKTDPARKDDRWVMRIHIETGAGNESEADRILESAASALASTISAET